MKNLKLGKKFAPIVLTGTLVMAGFTGCTKAVENYLNGDSYFNRHGRIINDEEADLEWLNILAACGISGTVGFKLGKSRRKMNCAIKKEHLHKYVSEEGFVTYKEGELLENSEMFWTPETIETNEELVLMSKFDLLKIDDNIDALETATKNDLPYKEYEYMYTSHTPVKVGKVTTMISHTHYDFTTDRTDYRVTGNARDVDYKYVGYRIGKNKEGKTALFKSKAVDDLMAIKDKYPYFKISNYKMKVYSDTYCMSNEKTK